ncbi:hypothetical protein QO010_003584 [Caulobacter ginsengisoli]|uniref:DUF2975 domain-containing protein n=1 Tax=Caulobacter ginsengisoli TaxID=400775 RepID=A0ABU0IUV3_9CAUL|nr:hypothetical protein [Caulobacter ginsengisoli]MDQ0465792.1 hypothetical protein [Caulobacter ginsengisoli]
MNGTGLKRVTFGDVVIATAGVVRRKGLLLLLLALGCHELPAILTRPVWESTGLSGLFISPAYDWLKFAIYSGSLAAALSAIAALVLNDLQADAANPGVLVRKALLRWPAMLAITAVINLPRLAAAVLMSLTPEISARTVNDLTVAILVSQIFELIFAALLGLAIPVLLQERGGILRAFRRARGLSREAGWHLAILALVWWLMLGLPYPLARLLDRSGILPFSQDLVLATQGVIDALWVTALCVVYLKQRRNLGQPPASAIGEVFD